jgi:type VI secretion system protein ImpF
MATPRQSSGELKEVPPSIVERLRGAGDAGRSATDQRVDVDTMRAEVLEHVQALLNTRLAEIDGLERFPESGTSLLAYGVPDLSAFFHGSQGDMQRMIACIERAIRTFEPRLDPQSVRVERVRDTGNDPVMKMRLRVQAVLRVHPFRAPIVFDTRIDADTASVTVHDADA